MTSVFSEVSRRSFMKWSGAVAGGAALVGTGVALTGTPGVGPNKAAANVEGMADADKTVWSTCNVNCGSRCPLRLQVKDGTLVRVLGDPTGSDEFGDQQLRACVRGRALKQRVYSADRIMHPMKRRPGTKRGEGKWDRITWEEAYEEIVDQFERIMKEYGNESLYFQYGSGSTGGNITRRSNWTHLLDVLGGYMQFYADYSTAMITVAGPYMYGEWVGGNSFGDAKHANLQVMWGNNPIETRMSGGGEMFMTQQIKKRHGVRTIVIDPRYSETALDIADWWIPIRPGTDAALAAAIAYVLITENMVDTEFIEKYTVGYDEASMAKNFPTVPAGNSYKSYILGEGAFAGDGDVEKGPKTPEWAAPITGIPAATIVALAREIGAASPKCAITQGWGIQRHANGDTACRAIFMIPILIGAVGINGGGTGAHESSWALPNATYPNYASADYMKAQAKARNARYTSLKLSCTGWFNAIDDGPSMTRLKDGVTGVRIEPGSDEEVPIEKLDVGIKLMVNACTNIPMGQHADINATRKLLEDETKLEFSVGHDHQMTPTMEMCDIVLPATITPEESDFVKGGNASDMGYFVVAEKAIDPVGESKPGLEVCGEIARRLGERMGIDYLTEFLSAQDKGYGSPDNVVHNPKDADGNIDYLAAQEAWVDTLINQTRDAVDAAIAGNPAEGKKPQNLTPLPRDNKEIREMGIWRQKNPAGTRVAFKAFRDDPEANPLKTPSGKIEIFSQKLWDMAYSDDPTVRWIIENPEKGDEIKVLPVYHETWEGPEEAKEKGMLQMIGHHYKGRLHSSYANLPWINEANRQELWMNPIDAKERGIENGDMVKVWNDRGTVHIPAKVTPRIAPGVTSLPQGAWFKEENGVDVGGNVNTLDRHWFTPLAKGNPQHTCLIHVEKLYG